MDYELIKNFWTQRSKSDKFLWRDDLTKLNIDIIQKYTFPNDSVLDLGAGDGKIAAELAKKCLVYAVDYIPDFITKIEGIRYQVCDIRKFTTPEIFDVILLFGVATHLEDDDLFEVYIKCHKMLKPGGYLLVKHQCGVEDTKIVSGYSEQLGTNYQAKYRHINRDIQMLTTSGFNVAAKEPYPPELNQKWPDTKFMLFIGTKM